MDDRGDKHAYRGVYTLEKKGIQKGGIVCRGYGYRWNTLIGDKAGRGQTTAVSLPMAHIRRGFEFSEWTYSTGGGAGRNGNAIFPLPAEQSHKTNCLASIFPMGGFGGDEPDLSRRALPKRRYRLRVFGYHGYFSYLRGKALN